MTRTTAVLFRVGTVLISISLALLLVSLIPSGQSTPSTNINLAEPQTWRPYYDGILSPQFGIHVSISGNATYKVYVLNVLSNDVYSWIFVNNKTADIFNVTGFNQYLDAHPNLVARQDEQQNGGTIQYDYIPTEVTNATFIITNPGPNYLLITFTWNNVRPFGPTSITLLAGITFIAGLVLIVPHLAMKLNARRSKNKKPN
jgi:hypothetical protein